MALGLRTESTILSACSGWHIRAARYAAYVKYVKCNEVCRMNALIYLKK